MRHAYNNAYKFIVTLSNKIIIKPEKFKFIKNYDRFVGNIVGMSHFRILLLIL